MEAGGEGGRGTWHSLVWPHGPADLPELEVGPARWRPEPGRPVMFLCLPRLPLPLSLPSPNRRPLHVTVQPAVRSQRCRASLRSRENIRCLPFHGPFHFEKFAPSLITFPTPKLPPIVLAFWKAAVGHPCSQMTDEKQ